MSSDSNIGVEPSSNNNVITTLPTTAVTSTTSVNSIAPHSPVKQAYLRVKFLLNIEIGENSLQVENHAKRLANLRKELIEIKHTDWRYEPIEKLIGQS